MAQASPPLKMPNDDARASAVSSGSLGGTAWSERFQAVDSTVSRPVVIE